MKLLVGARYAQLAMVVLVGLQWQVNIQATAARGTTDDTTHRDALLELRVSECARDGKLAHDAVVDDEPAGLADALGLVLPRRLVVLREGVRGEIPAENKKNLSEVSSRSDLVNEKRDACCSGGRQVVARKT